MSDLNRVKVGDFDIKESLKIEDIKKDITNNFISIEEFFKHNDKIILDENDLTRFLNGVKIFVEDKNVLLDVPLNVSIKNIYDTKDNFIGIGIIKDGVLKRDIVII